MQLTERQVWATARSNGPISKMFDASNPFAPTPDSSAMYNGSMMATSISCCPRPSRSASRCSGLASEGSSKSQKVLVSPRLIPLDLEIRSAVAFSAHGPDSPLSITVRSGL